MVASKRWSDAGRLAEICALSQEIKAALTAERTDFRNLLDLVLLYERADFTELQGTLEKLNLKAEEIAEVYVDSVERAEQALGLQSP